MKPETKRKLKKAANISWQITKFAGLIGLALIEGACESHAYPNIDGKSSDDLARENEERRRKQEEHEAFLNSLTPNERKLYDRIESVEHENEDLREQLADVSAQNQTLTHRVRDLESGGSSLYA